MFIPSLTRVPTLPTSLNSMVDNPLMSVYIKYRRTTDVTGVLYDGNAGIMSVYSLYRYYIVG